MSSYLNSRAKNGLLKRRPFPPWAENDDLISNNPSHWTWRRGSALESARDKIDDMIAEFERHIYGVLELKGMLPLISETNKAIFHKL